MKSFLFFCCLVVASSSFAQTRSNSSGYGYGTGSNSSSHDVSGHTRRDGTYVEPYRATNPNDTRTDNYGTKGNYNPYTGETGRRKN